MRGAEPTASTAIRSVPLPRTPKVAPWNDPVIRGWVFQIVVVGLVGLLAWYLVSNTIENLERQLMFTKKEASVDPLTGIANRRTFDSLLAEWMRRPGLQFVLAFIDVDDFKSINDTHGHMAGDQVLIAIANRLAQSFRSDDVVARIGGDEFAVLVSQLTLRQAEGRFSKLVAGLFPPPGDGTLPCLPKVTCGLAEFSAGDTPASLCVRADQAMYAAKRLGKHRVVAKEQAFVRDLMKR